MSPTPANRNDFAETSASLTLLRADSLAASSDLSVCTLTFNWLLRSSAACSTIARVAAPGDSLGRKNFCPVAAWSCNCCSSRVVR